MYTDFLRRSGQPGADGTIEAWFRLGRLPRSASARAWRPLPTLRPSLTALASAGWCWPLTGLSAGGTRRPVVLGSAHRHRHRIHGGLHPGLLPSRRQGTCRGRGRQATPRPVDLIGDPKLRHACAGRDCVMVQRAAILAPHLVGDLTPAGYRRRCSQGKAAAWADTPSVAPGAVTRPAGRWRAGCGRRCWRGRPRSGWPGRGRRGPRAGSAGR